MREFSTQAHYGNTPIRVAAPQSGAAQTRDACLGVACHLHHQCARYAAVEGMPGSEGAMGTCVKRDGSRPGFVEVA